MCRFDDINCHPTSFSDIKRKKLGGGGGQPDSDMKVDFAEIGIGKIGKIGISDYSSLKYRFLANFGKIGNKNFLGISYFSLKICYSYRNIRSYPS